MTTKFRTAILAALLAGSLSTALAAAGEVQILKVAPTVLFLSDAPLRQIARVSLFNPADKPLACSLAVTMGSKPAKLQPLTLSPGLSEVEAFVPDIAQPTPLALELRSESGQALATWRQDWQPQRKWKVYVMKSSHEDLGYEDYIFDKQSDIANFIDMACRLSGPADTPPGAAKQSPRNYHYTLETLIFQRNYIEERSEAAWREVVEKYVKTGRMALMGTPSGVHTHWMDYEELARMTYPARREAKDRFGLELDTFLLVDNPSVSWSACQALADAGFRYVARWGQPWRTGGNNNYATTKLPAIFWWQAPDGVHKVLFAWRHHYGLNFWYGMPTNSYADLTDLGARYVQRELQAIESGEKLGPYPYDAVIYPEYEDHAIPHFDVRALRQWQKKYRYPEIRIAGPTEFLQYIEKNFASQLPTLKGDLNNFSGDYAAIDPDSQGEKRTAARLLPLAEGLGALAGTLDPAFASPATLIDRTFTRLFDYDEHCWPTSPQASDYQVFNAQWVKISEARRAIDGARQAMNLSADALFKHVQTGELPTVVVFNPLAHQRTDLAQAPGQVDALRDVQTGELLPAQPTGEGTSLFLASNVPAYGYKCYEIVPGKTFPADASFRAQDNALENEFYSVAMDAKTGALRSLADKQTGRELVDAEAKYQFNQMIWNRKEGKESRKGSNYVPTNVRRISRRSGPVFAEITAEIDDASGTGAAVTQTVRLYRGLKRIDLLNDLSHIRALYSSYKNRYKENIYYAFPLRADKFEIRAEYPGGVVRTFEDFLSWGTRDFVMVNRWTDVNDGSAGVTLAPWNAPTLSVGDIRYNEFSIDYQPAKPHLYSYAYSNRMAGLATRSPYDCNAQLRYSLTSYQGPWNSGPAANLGWSVASPLETRTLPAGQKGSLPNSASFLSVSAPNVELVTLKNSTQPGRGWIVRLVETAGKQADVVLELPRLQVGGAMECDLVENDRQPLAIEGNKVRLSVGPFAFATVRIFAKDATPAQPGSLRPAEVTDSTLELKWAGNAPAWNIYRSDDPDAPATAYTLVGRSVKPEFTDAGLNLDTAYYYQVAGVTANNTQGALSEKLAAHTGRKNLSPPQPVTELGVIRRDKDQLIVFWRKSPEPDTARYYVYRGESADFTPGEPVGVVEPTRKFLQIFKDTGLAPGKTYYYKVLPEDWAGNRQSRSPVAGAETPRSEDEKQ